jgi:cytochrome c
MKRTILGCALAVAAVAALPASANQELAQKSGCMTCHGVDKKVIGPSFKDIAAKYKGNAKAEAELFTKVKQGGKGNWGDIPMPPNAHVKDDDIRTLVKWVLSQK